MKENTKKSNKIEDLYELEDKLCAAAHKIFKTSPLIYKIFKRVNIKIKENFIAPAAVGMSNKGTIEFIFRARDIRLSNSKDLTGLLEHECAHIIYKHLEWVNQASLDPKISNIAQDIVINDTVKHIAPRYKEIKENEKSILRNGLFSEDFKKEYHEYSKKSLKDTPSTELYSFLKGRKLAMERGEEPRGPIDRMINGKDGYEGFDSHEVVADKEGSASDKSGSMMSEISKVVTEAINDVVSNGQKFGFSTNDFDIYVDELMSTKSDFGRNISYFLNSVKVGVKRTWFKLNRRNPYLTKGHKKNKKPIIVLALDLSGSMMSEEILGKMRYEVEMYLKECKELWVVGGDSCEKMREKIKDNNFKWEDIKFTGGGGTTLQFLWDAAKEIKADGIIVHTDGYFNHDVNSHGVKTLVALYGKGKPMSQFRNIEIS